MPKVIEMDDRLIEAMQAGDESALSTVIDRYTAYVGTTVWNTVSGRLNEADAKEILSGIFYGFWMNRGALILDSMVRPMKGHWTWTVCLSSARSTAWNTRTKG